MILFVGGLYCYYNFGNYILNVFNKKNKQILFLPCRNVKQYDIDNCHILIAYSFAIQYLYKLDLQHVEKVILLNPLLNNKVYKDGMIQLADKLIEKKLPFNDLGIDLYLRIIGANPDTIPLWREDVYNYLNDFGSKEKEIENIEVKDDWIIIEGIKPVSKLPRIDDYATDNKGDKIRHILNYDNNLLFLDKYL